MWNFDLGLSPGGGEKRRPESATFQPNASRVLPNPFSFSRKKENEKKHENIDDNENMKSVGWWQCNDSLTTDDMTTMTTPTTRGWRSDVSIILPGWSVSLVDPGQYPRYTSAVKDGRPWVAQATEKAAKHHRNTTGTRPTPKLFHHGRGAMVERDRAMCFKVVQVWLLSSQCGCV